MTKPIPELALKAIETVISAHPDGIAIPDIQDKLEETVARRTLQYRLKHLVNKGRIIMKGDRRWAQYTVRTTAIRSTKAPETSERGPTAVPLSRQAVKIREYVCSPLNARTPVGYRRAFLDAYRPNEIAYLAPPELAHLTKIGSQTSSREQPAGTYARQILNRLLIDLSWNSSRMEGNTFSLLDTKRLINFGKMAEGKNHLDAQMILNHKDAIEFLIDSAAEITFNRYTILNLHALLANNLLPNPEATGRLRRIAVGIEKSTFHPLEAPALIKECFDQVLATAKAIQSPFEQAFFIMVHLPYLQPFDDVNKRVSRLAANIPFIKMNLTPLSFIDVPVKTYTEAMLGVYELNRVDLLKHVFIWAYERSVSRYKAVQQSLGEPDPFRLKHRESLRAIIQIIVLEQLDRQAAFSRIAAWAKKSIEANERDHFRDVTENEILALHEGNFARYRIKPSQFEDWQTVWNGPEKERSATIERGK
ncbi:MAG: Fic family protein [Aestuariivita sp.]|nr:Fic family protein [Aestuariivita sp.]